MPEGAVIDTVPSNYLGVHGWLVDTLSSLPEGQLRLAQSTGPALRSASKYRNLMFAGCQGDVAGLKGS